jgi:hypothetical protein
VRSFQLTQASFLLRKIVPRDRHGVLALRHLDLKDYSAPMMEGHLAGGETEFPHAQEAFVINPFNHARSGQEPLAPGFERMGIKASLNPFPSVQQAVLTMIFPGKLT